MQLGQLLNQLSEYKSVSNNQFDSIEISGISANSEEIKADYLFIAIPGYHVDGHDYIEAALEAGATVIVGEKEKNNLPVPYIRVPNSRLALAKLACQFYENPSKKRTVIGITGTNGKTTTSFMLKHILESAGKTCSLFGSVYNIVNGQQSLSHVNTTLDALELQRHIASSQDDVIIMEVSSHGLVQHRVWGIEFDYCLFTNLDQDHLDYHHDMEDYFSVKASLFKQLAPNGTAIINIYDSWGERLTELLEADGFKSIIKLGSDQYYMEGTDTQSSSLLYALEERFELKLKMLGIHNFKNAAMAFLTANKIGINSMDIVQALEAFQGVPGRFELTQHPTGANFIIDYAHTADAFYQCLQTAKDMQAKRIIHIFGFRGDRDQNKRHGMANVSRELSNLSILTLDDLNSVSIDEMTDTLHQYNLDDQSLVIPDRTLAIKHAWDHVSEGDWVFITGKGNEKYQQQFELPTTSDSETVKYLLESM